MLAFATAVYAFSPIDLIPDVIPVLGLLDDLLLVPAGIWLAIRLIPAPLMQEFRGAAQGLARPRSWLGAAIIMALWLTLAALFAWSLMR